MTNNKVPKKLVYICSRFADDTFGNTKKARKYCRFAAKCGVVPVAPHLLFPQFLNETTQRALAMELDLTLLKRCDEVWVFGVEKGISKGMGKEIMSAGDNGQEVRYFTEDCRKFI
ncbi:MAG: DUF4406 domain-containing protein [Clostridiales bacterium]|nr:DUF4406 domain-containing protein [Clostridiales bacterium]